MSRYTEIDDLGISGTPKYPEIPLQFSDYYVTTTIGDRFDILAQN